MIPAVLPAHPEARRIAEVVVASIESGEFSRLAAEDPDGFLLTWLMREPWAIPVEAAKEFSRWVETVGERLFRERRAVELSRD